MRFKPWVPEKAMKKIIPISKQIADIIQPTCAEHFARDKGKTIKTRGCCGGCAGTSGYLRSRYPETQIEEMKKKYGFKGYNFGHGPRQQPAGFLGPKGCKIPREERSHCCISFVCSLAAHRHPEIVPLMEEMSHIDGGKTWLPPPVTPVII